MLVALTSCASNPGPSEEDIAASAIMQSQWIGSLKPSQPLDKVVKPVSSYLQASFELLENGIVYQYLQGQIPNTNVIFGLYFENGSLKSLILDQQAGHFAWCRKNAWPHRYWQVEGFGTFSEWLKKNNQLNTTYDSGTSHPAIIPKSMNAAEVAEAATYLPIIVIALPLYGVDRMTGGYSRDKEQERLNVQLKKIASALQLGRASSNEVLQSMGSADVIEEFGNTEIWHYRGLDTWLGIVDGIVMWKESGPFYPPRNSSFTFDNVDCNGIQPTEQP